jgi:hypothetical protein
MVLTQNGEALGQYLFLDCGAWRTTIFCVHESATAFLHYPGDVEYPKSVWKLRDVGPRESVKEYARRETLSFQTSWDRR